jgi:hypothetical protein
MVRWLDTLAYFPTNMDSRKPQTIFGNFKKWNASPTQPIDSRKAMLA